MNGFLPRVPRLYYNVVDVRDVADLHLRAMTDPAAKGERFLAAADGPVSMREAGQLLRARLGHAARRVPAGELPDWTPRSNEEAILATVESLVRLGLVER